jgi:endoglycosylceramidase
MQPRRGVLAVASLTVALVASLVGPMVPGAATPTTPRAAASPSAAGPTGTMSHDGRWFVDEDGRVVQLHGVNFVAKWPAEDPMTPAEAGFDADDAAFLREQGFNVVRLGVVFGAVMPSPGVIDTGYVDAIVDTVDELAAAGLYVQLDFHQDGFGPLTHGNGFPAWATLTDGLPNPNVGFPLYYVQNPAMQRAFDNFWNNVDGPDGVPLQEHYATAMRTVAAEVADEPYVLGYDTMNEPWPGTDWNPCVTGCPAIEQARLAPFAERMTAAIRSVDDDAFVFTEPFVLFNFGQTDTSLHGFGAPHAGLSFHVYALTAADDEAVIDRAIAASANGDAIIATEFGATNDPANIDRLTAALDTRLVPWMFWAYDEHVVHDIHEPPTAPGNVREPVLHALARPYATATNGVPTSFAYDPATATLDYEYATTRTDGSGAPVGLPTVIAVPPSAYPDGYTVEVVGASVASAPGAAELVLCHDPGVTEVSVRLTAGADPNPPTPTVCEPPPGPSTSTTTTPGGPGPTDPATGRPLAAPAAVVATPVPRSPRFTG